mmetsp:Transcript_13376/g.31847  ORF Transcript_13376/g.31847 Transcript_13376/m.31847 type:complete len:467 (-) Transcript_13376:237-1637(-)
MVLLHGRHRGHRDDPKTRKERLLEAKRLCPSRRTGVMMLLLLLVAVSSLHLNSGFLSMPLRADARRAQSARFASSTREPPRMSWQAALHMMRRSSHKYVVVDVKNGLGNRLRAMASARAVAAALGRPMLLVWQPDLHCNCSFQKMFQSSDPMVSFLDEEIPQANLSSAEFQKYNYMRPEPGAIKDEYVRINGRLHLYFKSAFIMNHPHGKWRHAQRYVQKLVPVPEVSRRIIADSTMVGLHIRNVFDAPRDEATSRNTVGSKAMEGAKAEYGAEGARQLLTWRKASHWSNFVSQVQALMREHGYKNPGMARAPLHFYLAADTAEAYIGLQQRFPSRILFTQRNCSDQRCDYRDCTGMIYSLIDMMNLARTRLILGSGWSSYSEVAAYMGGDGSGNPVPMLMAGRDFGQIVDRGQVQADSILGDEQRYLADANPFNISALQQYWPKPFGWDGPPTLLEPQSFVGMPT